MTTLSVLVRKEFLYSAAIVIAASLIGSHVLASDSRPLEIVQEAEQSIQKNQPRLAELKPLVEEFNALKADNAYNVGRIEAHGYCFSWDTLKAAECPKE